MRKERTNYRKIAKSVALRCPISEYNKWLNSPKARLQSERDFFLIYSGIRIGRGVADQMNFEELQKILPISEEELDYYSKL